MTDVTFDGIVASLDNSIFAYSSKLSDIYYPACAYAHYTSSLSDYSDKLKPYIKLESEWAAYCATGSFDVPDDIKAYVAEQCVDSMVMLRQVSTINEGQGVLLNVTERGKAYMATVKESPTTNTANLLTGVTANTEIASTEDSNTNFILDSKEGETGFYPITTTTVLAYSAYLPIPTSSLPAGTTMLHLSIDGQMIDGISPILDVKRIGDRWWYTLDGIRIAQPQTKGIYIHNGKKVFFKF